MILHDQSVSLHDSIADPASRRDTPGARVIRFVMGPTEGHAAAIFRVCLGLLAMWQALQALLNVERYFGPHAMIDSALAQGPIARLGAVSFAPSSIGYLYGLGGLLMFAGLMVALGVWPRLFAALVAYLHISFQLRNPYIVNAADLLFGIVCVLSIAMPLGKVGAVRSRERAGTVWGQRLVGIQVCFVYLITAIQKVSHEVWQDGTALRYVFKSPLLAEWPADISAPWIIAPLTYGTLVFEFAFPILVWTRLRRWLLAAGTIFHVGIDITTRIPLFSVLMISSYAVFLSDDEARRLYEFVRFRRRRRASDHRSEQADQRTGEDAR